MIFYTERAHQYARENLPYPALGRKEPPMVPPSDSSKVKGDSVL